MDDFEIRIGSRWATGARFLTMDELNDLRTSPNYTVKMLAEVLHLTRQRLARVEASSQEDMGK